jgi:hypothetical protein
MASVSATWFEMPACQPKRSAGHVREIVRLGRIDRPLAGFRVNPRVASARRCACRRDFVEIGGKSGRAQSGHGLTQLGAAGCDTLREEIRPYLLRLANQVDETVDSSVLDGSSARFIDQIL